MFQKINLINNSSLNIKIILPFFAVLFLNCNEARENNSEIHEKISSDTIIKSQKQPISQRVVPLDSAKMHAIDNLYFGNNINRSNSKFELDGLEYGVKISKALPDNRVYYYMIHNNSTITTKQKAERVLDKLKKIISNKYKNITVLNRTYNSKHPEEDETLTSPFEQRSPGEFDKNLIGQPYEFAAYRWDLKYKVIQIGYFIDNKNKTRYMESKPENDFYNVYIELTSTLLKPVSQKKSKDGIEKDSNKF